MNEDELAANFSFHTVEEPSSNHGFVRRQRRKSEISDSRANLVFVWGLNDRQQLGVGGPDTKVGRTGREEEEKGGKEKVKRREERYMYKFNFREREERKCTYKLYCFFCYR